MRIRMLTAWILCALVMARAAEKPLHADRVVVLKKERTLQLLSEGKVIRTYKVALGGDPVGPKARRGDHKLRRESTFWIRETRKASFIDQFIFRIQTHAIVPRRGGREFRRVATFSSTDCRMGTDGSGHRIARGIGTMAVSPSRMKRSRKSGMRLLMAHRSRFVREEFVAAPRSRV